MSPHWLAAQVALDRAGYSPGEIDGRAGTNTTRALEGFQQAHSLSANGQLDEHTIAALGDAFQAPTTSYVVSDADMAGPFVPSLPKDMMQLATIDALDTGVRGGPEPDRITLETYGKTIPEA